MKPFIKGHILRVLNQYQQEIEYKSCYSVYKTIPFELYIKKYLKINRENLSASDNISIISTSFKLLRFKEFLDHAFKCNDWSDRLESSGQLYEISWQSPEIQDLPLYVQCSCPKDLFDILSEQYGEEKTFAFCSQMLHGKTQLSLRINPQKVLRENLIESLNKKYRIISRKCLYSPLGLRVLEKESSHSNLFKIQEFINGEFVSQNEAYQLTLLKIKPQPNDRILDFRCKLGEKALTLASLFKGIEIVLFEEKGNFIDACRKNFELAQISYKLIDDIEILEKNEKKFDWVLLDVPCSETGLMRERPEVKLKFSLEALEGLEGLQRKLIEESLKFLKPNVGKFVYFTNSILEEENMKQIATICERKGVEMVDGKYFQSYPDEEGMVGHFSAIVKQKPRNKKEF